MLLISQPGRGTILNRMRSILTRSKDLSPLVEPVRTILTTANRDRAMKGVGFDGHPYVKLAPRTLDDRARRGYPAGPPLNRQGAKARVITGVVIQVTVRDDQVRFLKSWPDVDFIRFHIEGTTRMPQRNPAGFSQEELRQAAALLPRHVLGRPTY